LFSNRNDAAARLVGESLDSSDNSLDYVDAFTFDLTGNRLATSRNWGDAATDDYSVFSTFDVNDRGVDNIRAASCRYLVGLIWMERL
jgi:hypothetical protein